MVKMKNNKVKLIRLAIISVIVIIIIGIILSQTEIINQIKNRRNAEEETSYTYNNPYIPDGFYYVDGDCNTGFIIEDAVNGNQFVWIPVDGTTVKLERKNYSVSDTNMEQCSEELDSVFSDSVTEYGGYYVARYESGVPENSNFETDDDMDSTGKPVSKQGAKVWNNISYTNAKASAEQMYATKSEITSNLMNSYAYDTMLTWIESKGFNVETDSKSWGNYSDNNNTNGKVEVTGASNTWKANNIYDLAGNVSEWTSEKKDAEYIYRGGSYYNAGNITPAGMREVGNEYKSANTIGFRTIIYKTGESTIEGYNAPYIPDGFTHTEGEWNNGFVIKESATGNEFVWIPVDGYNLNLDRSEFEKTFTTMGKSADTMEIGLKLSIYSYGGYYVSRYEAGVGETSGNNVGVPVSKKGATVWTNISQENAKTNAKKMYEGNGQINSTLMNSYAYDTMLNWLKKTDYSANTYNVDTDSTSWGNYRNNESTSNSKTLSGSNEQWKANNIYDLAGNVWEWTTETYNKEAVVRGGDYLSNGDILPAGTRDHAVKSSVFDHTGYRILMYKDKFKEEGTVEAKVEAGIGYSVYLDASGNLWTWGNNKYGQLGNGTTTDSNVPQKIQEETKFKEISSNFETCLAIDEEGNLWSWGYNYKGQLGNGTTTDSKVPQKIQEGTKFKKISANYSCLAIDEEGNLWAWGSNESGQLGDGTTTSSKTPKKIQEGTKFKEISTGVGFYNSSGSWTSKGYSLAIDEDGNLWSWGYNGFGQLGDGTTTVSKTPKKIQEGTKFKKIKAGESYNLAIDEEGNLWTWGRNSNGQLGDGTTTVSKIPQKIQEGIKFKEISAGGWASYAIDENENLWSWGYNKKGQLGNGTTTDSKVPQKIQEGTKFKKVDAAGANMSYNALAHFLAIDEAGNLWACGRNNHGQLGNGTTTDSSIPIRIN